ncbi:MAG: FadR family transcriptional regulator [Microbacteriaceae bacterium]|nr:FadR family transcriptional regulator [Microbacteriaceae bacterium]
MLNSPQSGSQKARDTLRYLRAQITENCWPVGELIPKESELMAIIGVGKSTIREAVRALATLGMLQTVPGVGTYVRARTPVSTILAEFLADHDLGEILTYRRSLEIEAAQSASIRRTDEQLLALQKSYQESINSGGCSDEKCFDVFRSDSFHRLVVEASGSRLLSDLYTGVMHILSEAAKVGIIFMGANQQTVITDHRVVLKAIETRNIRDAAHGMALHVDRDLGIQADTLDFWAHTERVETFIEAGLDPDIS